MEILRQKQQIRLEILRRSGHGVLFLNYDSVQRHLLIEKLVTRTGFESQERRHYRIRSAMWYGGIVTADCVGCGLLCKFCWVSDAVMTRPANIGKFYSPKGIADELSTMAKKKRLNQLRVSGGEPTIGNRHLLQFLDQLQSKGYNFILETNGILIGHDENYARDLSKYNFIHVRVSLKGCNEQEFATLTGAKPEGFTLQLKSLQYLIEAGVSCHPSVMASFSSEKHLQNLVERLNKISLKLAENLELEELILYPHVIKRLQKYKLLYPSAQSPNNVPPQQI